MKTKISLLLLSALFPLTLAFGGGLDLDYYYGSRYVYLGGNQVSILTDAYAPFYNPASMTGVEKGEIALNTSNLLNQFSAPIGADNQQRKSQWNYGPLFYMGGVYRLADRVALGFAIFPTALEGGKYSNVSYGPIAGKEFSNLLARIEFAPSIAIKLIDQLSIGASYRVAYNRYNQAGGLFFGNNSFAFNSSLTSWDASGLKVGAFLDHWKGLSA